MTFTPTRTGLPAATPNNLLLVAQRMHEAVSLLQGGFGSDSQQRAIRVGDLVSAGLIRIGAEGVIEAVRASGGEGGVSWDTIAGIPANIVAWVSIAPSAKQDALGFTPVNKAGDTGIGDLNGTAFNVRRGTIGTQQIMQVWGYATGPDRMYGVLEASGAYAVYLLDSAGNPALNAYQKLSIALDAHTTSITSANGLSHSGPVRTLGSSAALWFQQRDSSTMRCWYNTGGLTRLFNGSSDNLTINDSGHVRIGAVGGSPAAPLDVAVAGGNRLLVRQSGGGRTTLDAVNAANSAFTDMEFTATGFRFSGGVVDSAAGFDMLGGATQGAQSRWNVVAAGEGRNEFINNRGGGSGGFAYYSRVANTDTPVFVGRIGAGGAWFDGTNRRLGYREAPLNILTSSRAVTTDDISATVYNNQGASRDLTLNSSVIPAGCMFQVICFNGAINLLRGSGVELYYFAGTATPSNANRTVAIGGWATVYAASATVFFVTGVGVS